MKRLLIAIAAFAAAAPAQAATNFFNNWDSTNFGASPGFTILQSYEGWTNVTGLPGSGIEIQYNNRAGAPFSGANLVELDSNRNSVMERAIEAGIYTLSFYFSPRPNQPESTNGIDVLINGVSQLGVSAAGGAQTDWTQYVLNFQLNAPGTLRFAATGTDDSLGGYLEDVRLVGTAAVPEPATWAMMIFGFGFVGMAMRRRRQARVAFA